MIQADDLSNPLTATALFVNTEQHIRTFLVAQDEFNTQTIRRPPRTKQPFLFGMKNVPYPLLLVTLEIDEVEIGVSREATQRSGHQDLIP